MTDRKTAADLMLAQLIGKVSEEDIQMLHVDDCVCDEKATDRDCANLTSRSRRRKQVGEAWAVRHRDGRWWGFTQAWTVHRMARSLFSKLSAESVAKYHGSSARVVHVRFYEVRR